MKLFRILLLVIFYLSVFSTLAFSENISQSENKKKPKKITPFQFSLYSPAQVFSEKWSVYGLRASVLFGKNRNVYGLDAGLLCSKATGDLFGIQASSVNIVKKDVSGIQLGLFSNFAGKKLNGLQLSPCMNFLMNDDNKSWGAQLTLVANFASDNHKFTGMQLGMINVGSVNGLQVGLCNGGEKETWVYAKTGAFAYTTNSDYCEINGLQIGLGYNIATELGGFQLAGLFNEAEQLTGGQIACFNEITKKSGTFNKGFQIGIYNDAKSLKGFQLGLGNIHLDGELKGVQFGAINIGHKVSGLQFGAINLCEQLKGVQIGLINFISTGRIKLLPIVNFCF